MVEEGRRSEKETREKLFSRPRWKRRGERSNGHGYRETDGGSAVQGE